MFHSRNPREHRPAALAPLVWLTLFLSPFPQQVATKPANDPVVSLNWPVAVEEKFKVERPTITYVYKDPSDARPSSRHLWRPPPPLVVHKNWNLNGTTVRRMADVPEIEQTEPVNLSDVYPSSRHLWRPPPPLVVHKNWNLNGTTVRQMVDEPSMEQLEPLDLPELDESPTRWRPPSPPSVSIEELPPVNWIPRLPTTKVIDAATPFSADKPLQISPVDNFMFKNVSNTLFAMPKKPTSSLTRLITGSEVPTFLHDKLVRPQQVSKDPNSNVIARYRFIVPVIVPAVRPKVNVIREPEIKVVHEYTENVVVPVKKNMTEWIRPPPEVVEALP